MQQRIAALALAVAASLVAALPAAADSLQAAFARVLDDPTNAELNVSYAMIAEARGEYRKALAAYERALVSDPANDAARRGLVRVRRLIQPPLTQVSLETGATWESNALPQTAPGTGDFSGYAAFTIRDERVFGAHRWRTNVGLYGELHASATDLDYASLAADTGPLIDLAGTMLTVRPALGVGTALFQDRLYYGDANAGVTVEGYLNGAYQWARVRVGYRQYDPFFTADRGAWADLTGKFSLPNVFHQRDVFSISPWLRWSGIDGDPDFGVTDFAPGRYVSAGARFEYAKVLNDAVTVAVNFKVSDTAYADIGSGSRNDLMLSPGASVILTGLLGPQTDLRFDYRYEHNDSNDAAHDYDNHIATVAAVFRR